jgi:hypothetical protein
MNFLDIAMLLGHDHATLKRCHQVETFRLLNDDESCTLVSRATPAQRLARRETFFHPGIAARSRLPQGYHDRAEGHVFAAWPLTENDFHFIHKQMPMPARILSVASKTVHSGQTWNISVRPAHWGLSSKQDCFVIANIDELRLEPGARVIVEGNILSFHCQRLISDGGILEILPAPFVMDDNGGPFNGCDGKPGRRGAPGTDGSPIPLINSFLGPVLREDFPPGLLHGQFGEHGQCGTDAGHGRGGGMCKTAEITLLKLEGQLTLFAQAGCGGTGGTGGDGGDGGQGGDGSQGCFTVAAAVRGGDGGAGGNGGNGGRGGNGGHGGLSSNIYVTLPRQDLPNLHCIALPSPGGAAGSGGNAGRPGASGVPGSIAQSRLTGEPGDAGTPGVAGTRGRDGRSRPAPWIFINNEPQFEVAQPAQPTVECTSQSRETQQQQQGEQSWTSISAQQSLATPASV